MTGGHSLPSPMVTFHEQGHCWHQRRGKNQRLVRRRRRRRPISSSDLPAEPSDSLNCISSWRRPSVLVTCIALLMISVDSVLPTGAFSTNGQNIIIAAPFQKRHHYVVGSRNENRRLTSQSLLAYGSSSPILASDHFSTLKAAARSHHDNYDSSDPVDEDEARPPYDTTITPATGDIPRHVAFICDGNSRWAQQHNCSTSQGHWKGADRLVDLLEQLSDDGIAYCTLYGFSTENWKRPRQEIQEIFRVMEQTARKLVPRLLHESSSIQLRILGDLEDDRIPWGLRKILQELQKLTDQQSKKKGKQQHQVTTSTSLTVCLAINYGGRQDILQASQKMAAAVIAGEMSAEEMTEATMASYLSTAGIPDPDLIIRTSGEHRLSNFLLWNAAYSELYVTNILWPDFDIHCWHEALRWYQQRSRRFGSRTQRATQMDVTTASSVVDNERQGTNTREEANDCVGDAGVRSLGP